MDTIKDTFTIQNSQRGIVARIQPFDLVRDNYFPNWMEEEEIVCTFTSPYPSIEVREFSAGERAVIRGTRISVSNIISYLLMGEKPQTISEEILPSISMLEIMDAIRYYQHYRFDINNEISANSEEDLREHFSQLWSFSG